MKNYCIFKMLILSQDQLNVSIKYLSFKICLRRRIEYNLRQPAE